MKRLLLRLARFFWSWSFLKVVLIAITVIVLLYAEEDWRGARAWAATKARWEARGETLDFKDFIPPPIPDDQNLAAIPAFRLEQVRDSRGGVYLDDAPLRDALRHRSLFENDFPFGSQWRRGQLPDMEQLRRTVAARYTQVSKSAPSADPLVQLDELYPLLPDLRAAAARPDCRFAFDDSGAMPAGRALGLITSQLFISKILTLRALFELEDHRSDAALEDLRINFKLISGVERDPSIVSALVVMGMYAISSSALYDGLAQHGWSDSQLAEIDRMLRVVNFPQLYSFAMRAEAAEAAANIDDFKNDRPELIGWTELSDSQPTGPQAFFFDLSVRSAQVFPAGWWDQNKSQLTDLILQFLGTTDPKARRAFPSRVKQLGDQVRQRANRWDANLPWNFFHVMASSYLPTEPINFARAQA